ncbi:MAG: ribosome-associated translation inhibitor RaiA [bacterium]
MKNNIKTTDFSLTPAISDYLDKKIIHLDKFVSPEHKEKLMCYIELGKPTNHHKTGDIFKAEFTIHIGGKVFRATSETDDLYSAIDTVNDEMAEELRTFNSKETSLIKRSGAKFKSFLRKFYENGGQD